VVGAFVGHATSRKKTTNNIFTPMVYAYSPVLEEWAMVM